MLRSHCQKLRVVEKLSGGSHLLIPSEQPSIAIRAYFPCDLEELSPSTCQDDDDFDNLRTFLNSFKSALVMFILPLDKQREQLDNPNSFFHRAQRVLRSMTIESVEANPVSSKTYFLL